jgi:hypothetical protein
LQFAAKCTARYMSSPREHDWAMLKRTARYLISVPRIVQHFDWQELPRYVHTFTDSDWAGDKQTRKSTTGGAMMLGKHLIKSWSTTQQVIATSSGEAELYALVKGAYQTKGFMSMLADMGHVMDGKVCTDASAAIGIVHRRGLGKVKHLDVQYLWVQQEVNDGRLGIEKVGTLVNPADLFTKALCGDTIDRHLIALGFQKCTGRAKTAPTLGQLTGPRQGKEETALNLRQERDPTTSSTTRPERARALKASQRTTDPLAQLGRGGVLKYTPSWDKAGYYYEH